MPSRSEKESLVRKYDAIASVYSARYRDPAAVARRQVALLARWGRRLDPGATVLELGCADGLVTEALAQAGFRVTAVDISPAMIEAARRRLDRAGLRAELLVADIDEFQTSATFDAVLGVMGFFHYSSNPSCALRRLALMTAGKILVDANPRQVPIAMAVQAVRSAGFVRVRWRPFFVPQRVRLPRPALGVLAGAERVPGLRAILLRQKFKIVVLGER